MRSPKLAAAVAALLALALAAPAAARHGGALGHLPPSASNMELVGKIQLTGKASGIADVAAFKNHAYLAAWNPLCPNGGVFVVDVSNPAAPKQVAFAKAPARYYVGEGVHVMSMSTPAFAGDVLLMNHEPCSSPDDAAGAGPPGSGGFSLWDVTDPTNPRPLTGLVGDLTTPDGKTRELPNSSHSIQGWATGNKAYAVLVDNVEATDIDIFDITNPRVPALVSETDLSSRVENVVGHSAFFHDVQMEEIGGRMTMLVSYWDAGWILLDVTDPAKPTVLKDYDFPRTDLSGSTPEEGNAHQAFWSSSKRYIIGTSEDFNPYRLRVSIMSGSFTGEDFEAASFGRVAPAPFPPRVTPETPLIGGHGRKRPSRAALATYYLGLACDPLPPAPASQAIGVVQRGTCTFGTKVANAQAAGYAAVVVFNSAAPGNCETVANGAIDRPVDIPPVFVGRSTGFKILGISGYNPANCPTGANPALPAVGTRGLDIDVQSRFDAWGDVHLIDASTFGEIAAYAVREALDPSYANSFGVLSVHEVKTDPRAGINLGYLSYYNAGARVVQFGRAGIQEVGHFNDEGGNNFWGTFPHYLGTDPNVRPKDRGDRPLLLFSDRDYGLYILRYTGPEPAPEP